MKRRYTFDQKHQALPPRHHQRSHRNRRIHENLSFDEFSENVLAIRAVTMHFIVIGEAAKHLPAEIRRKHPQIPWSKIVGMQNILTHDYPETDTEIIWKTAKKRLPELKEVIREIINEGYQ